MNNRTLLITGATGFVGSALVECLEQTEEVNIRLALRGAKEPMPRHANFIVGDLGPDNDWREALDECDAVVHCAARVHVMNDNSIDSLAEFRRVNVEGTLNLARQASEAGVKRFVFISSIKVNGERTPTDTAFGADDEPAPMDPYAISKYEAEQGLFALARTTGMDVVVIRPPLVYGPGVKGNFLTMIRWLNSGVPLPLGAVCNKRSLVARENLVDLVVRVLSHPAAANQVFLAGDGVDLSTTELLRHMAAALGRPARLVPVPVGILKGTAALLGKQAMAERLCGSLRVDISKTQVMLDWQPPVTIDSALKATAMATFVNEMIRYK
jgi:nucleoside-diphosphate-sugar epimerase